MQHRAPLAIIWILLLVPALRADGGAVAPPVQGVVETVGEGADAITVLYTWGTPREMGYAHGVLLREQVLDLYRNSLPRFLLGLSMSPAQVDDVWRQLAPFVPADDLEEMEGLAEGVGAPLTLDGVHRCHTIPEIAEWHCTFLAAWGSATPDGELVQIRALDFATEAALQFHPLITVAFPEGGQPYVNVGWTGFVGMVTGMNSSGIAMSEIGDDWDQDADTYAGTPMVFVMKDVVRRSRALGEAIARVRMLPRTSCYLYCLGDAKIPDARALVTSSRRVIGYSPRNFPYEHVDDCVYFSNGTDSSRNPRLGALLQSAHGQITPEFAIEQVMGGMETGDLHAVCFHPASGRMWVANAEGDLPSVVDAFRRPFVEFDTHAAFAKVRELAGEGR